MKKHISHFNNRNSPRDSTSGFTLIELLVVIAIIGLLSSIVLVSLNSARVKARDAKRISQMRQLLTVLELYYSDNNVYPTAACDGDSEPATQTCCSSWQIGNDAWISGIIPTYLPRLIHDPLEPPNPGGPDICYSSYPNDGNRYRIRYRLEKRQDETALGIFGGGPGSENGVTVYYYDITE